MVGVYTISVGNGGASMENPASWSPTQKKISLALRSDGYYSSEQATHTANTILATLKANSLLKRQDLNITDILCEEIRDYQQGALVGRFGPTLATRLYNKLIAVGAL